MSQIIDVTGTLEVGGVNIMPDIESYINWNDDPTGSPIATTLVLINGTEQVDNAKVEWDEGQMDNFSIVSDAIDAAGAGVTQTAVLQGLVGVYDTLYHGPTQQRFQVVGFGSRTDTATTCTIVRIPLTKPTVAIAGTPVFRVMPTMIPEGGRRPIAKGKIPTRFFNYTAVQHDVTGMTTRMSDHRTYYQEGQWMVNFQDMKRNHEAKFERFFWWATMMNENRTITDESGYTAVGPITSPSGLDELITNRTSYTTLDRATFRSLCDDHFFNSRNSGPLDAMLIVDKTAFGDINELANDKLVIYEGQQEYGIDLRTVIGPGGRRFELLEEREFSDYGGEEEGTIYKIYPDDITVCALGNTMTRVKPAGTDDFDNKLVQMRTDAGFKFKHAATRCAKAYKS